MGLFDFMKPTQNVNPGQVIHDPRVGDLQTAPTLGGQSTFLDRLRAPDDRGLTFGDKLFAAGGIAQGDSSGAMQYLQNQRQTARTTKLQDMQLDDRKRRSAAFKAAMATGQFDPAVYAQISEDSLDPDDLAKLQGAFRSHRQFVQGGGGGVYLGDPESGQFEQMVKPPPKSAGGYVQDPDTGEWSFAPGGPADPAVIRQLANIRRQAVTSNPMPKAAGKGRAPKSYGAADIRF